MAKRYWRLVGAYTTGGAALDLSECRLYEGGVIADSGATLTCTIAPTSGALADLRDGVATSVVSWPVASYSAPGWALNWDFGVGGGVDAPVLRLGSGTTKTNWLLDATLQYCTDGVSWVTNNAGIVGITYPGNNALTSFSPGDIYAANNSLLLLGNGANGSTSIVDSSVTNPKTVTAVGNVQISTAQSQFGGSSIYFDGAGDYLSVPTSDDFNFYAGDFTIELFAYFRTVGTTLSSNYNGIISRDNIGVARGWLVLTDRDVSGKLNFACFSGTTAYIVGTTSAPAVNTWSHYAFVRSGSSLMCFKDGVLQGSTNIGVSAINSSSDPVYVGCLRNTNAPMALTYFDGYMHLRTKKGVALYTANFVPPGSFADAVIIPSAYTARASRTVPVPDRLLPAVEMPNTALFYWG